MIKTYGVWLISVEGRNDSPMTQGWCGDGRVDEYETTSLTEANEHCAHLAGRNNECRYEVRERDASDRILREETNYCGVHSETQLNALAECCPSQTAWHARVEYAPANHEALARALFVTDASIIEVMDRYAERAEDRPRIARVEWDRNHSIRLSCIARAKAMITTNELMPVLRATAVERSTGPVLEAKWVTTPDSVRVDV